MFRHAVGAGGHGVGGFTFTACAAGLRQIATEVRADDADCIVDRERQRHRAPFLFRRIEEDELGFRSAAARQRRQQLEPPVVFVSGQDLPTLVLFVEVAPDPIAATELGREQAGGFVELDDLLPFGRWVADQLPNRLRRFVFARRVKKIAAEIMDGPTTGHEAITIRLGFVRATAAAGEHRAAGLPRASQFKHGETRSIAEPHIRPLHPAAPFFPQDAGRTVRDALQMRGDARYRFAKPIRFLQHINLHRSDARDHRFADHLRRQSVFQHDELAPMFLGRHATAEDDFVLEWVQLCLGIVD